MEIPAVDFRESDFVAATLVPRLDGSKTITGGRQFAGPTSAPYAFQPTPVRFGMAISPPKWRVRFGHGLIN
jgi:hypothetical protein